jgi:hypothetical protein
MEVRKKSPIRLLVSMFVITVMAILMVYVTLGLTALAFSMGMILESTRWGVVEI